MIITTMRPSQLDARKRSQKSDYALVSAICKKKTIKYLGNVIYNLYLPCKRAGWGGEGIEKTI